MAGITDLKLTDDDDLAVEGGDLVLVSDDVVTAQLLRQRTKTILGEMEWDTRVGMSSLLSDQELTIVQIQSEYRVAIGTTPGVKGIKSLTFDLDPVTRELRIGGDVYDASGRIVTFSETLYPGGST